MEHQQEYERDELRARFTGWLQTMVYRAKLNYLHKNRQGYETVSIDDIPETLLIDNQSEMNRLNRNDAEDAFGFEEERLAKAFSELPLMRQRILTMLFVEEKKPAEIAENLHCTVQHVYNQRSLALKKLRVKIEGGGDDK